MSRDINIFINVDINAVEKCSEGKDEKKIVALAS